MSSSGSGWPAPRGRAPIAVVVATVVVAVIGIATPGFASTINVNCSTQSLQSKINSAPAGSTLLIKGTCLGNFVVDKNLTLKGDPTATLDGNDAGTTLAIPNVHTVHLIGLTITGGLASLGAGINRPSGGVLTLSKVAVQFNLASGTSVAGGGGIVAGNGQLVLTKSQVVGNRAVASGSGHHAYHHHSPHGEREKQVGRRPWRVHRHAHLRHHRVVLHGGRHLTVEMNKIDPG
jgi:hypothetical protein